MLSYFFTLILLPLINQNKGSMLWESDVSCWENLSFIPHVSIIGDLVGSVKHGISYTAACLFRWGHILIPDHPRIIRYVAKCYNITSVISEGHIRLQVWSLDLSHLIPEKMNCYWSKIKLLLHCFPHKHMVRLHQREIFQCGIRKMI